MSDDEQKTSNAAGIGSGAAGFLVCLLAGIIVDQVAIGILAGLVFGAAIGKALSSRDDRPESE